MTDPFPGVARRRPSYRSQNWPRNHIAQSTPRGKYRAVLHQGTYHWEVSLHEWFSDRADLLGVPLATLFRDIMVAWQQGVIAGEDERGIRLDDERPEFSIPERTPGYTDAIYPRGLNTSHLDSSPLGLGEL